jgi:type II secretory ATPase GspE/PulE/Tfp pilus assembly ATPase PilB-like protein
MSDQEFQEEHLLASSLLEHGLLNRSQLDYAQRRHSISGGSLALVLVQLGLVSEQQVARHLAIVRDLPFVDRTEKPAPEQQALSLFRREFCQNHALLPLASDGTSLHILIGDAVPEKIVEAVKRRVGLQPVLYQGEFSAVARAIDHAYSSKVEDVREQLDREVRRMQADDSGSLGTENLFRALLQLAASERATDIHLNPDAAALLVSFRIDGVLIPVVALNRSLLRVIAAIKVAAGMDIGDSLRPQDGRFSGTVDGRTFDIRVSTTVTPHGESVVMRLLSKGTFVSGLEDLAFYPEHVPMLDRLFCQPHGIVLMTGPTGSGKTTTLYAGLKPHGMSGKSIITVEDPIEYELPAACQTQVNRKAQYTFDTAIKHFLRHDPDIMLVGEIRDAETADAAMRASETGHLVLSTLHVNSALSVPSRLVSLGVNHRLVSEALIGVVNQRLVRLLCPCCKVVDDAPSDTIPRALRARLADKLLYRAIGCDQCRMTGYNGRVPAYEILLIDAAVARWIDEGASRHTAASVLHADNYVDMMEVCARRIADGQSSVEEFLRVYGSSQQAPGNS